MRTVTGAILLLAAVHAFSNAYLVGFPNAPFVQDLLVPVSGVLGVMGIAFLVWGVFADYRKA